MFRDILISLVSAQFVQMGLHVLKSGSDYRGSKPDIVIAYPDKFKYYLVEAVADDCFMKESNRLQKMGFDHNARNFCKKLYPDNRLATWAASLYCDLGQAVELFHYKEIDSVNFSVMQKYAAVVYPITLVDEAEAAFNTFKLEYRSLNVLDAFVFTLFSQNDTEKLSEVRRFMNFLSCNT